MSADDPTDDELEREARADTPYAGRKNGPKLSEESRAINPRAQLEAERFGQSQGSRQPLSDAPDFPDVAEFMRRQRLARYQPMPSADTTSRAIRGPAPVLRLRGGPQPPPDTRRADEAEAWDRFLVAALELVAQLGHDDIEGAAIGLADRLLEERRGRFG